MGYRSLIAVLALTLMSACAAFDNSAEPYEGFSPSEVPAPTVEGAGIYAGHYTGDIKADSNTCQTVSDKVGESIPLAFDITQKDAAMMLQLDGGETANATLGGTKADFLLDENGVRHVFYMNFGKDTVDGSCEVFEKNDKGDFTDPCASYKITLKKNGGASAAPAAPAK